MSRCTIDISTALLMWSGTSLGYRQCFQPEQPTDKGEQVTPRGTEGGEPPRCGGCGAYLRPDVVWFGEQLPEQVLNPAWAAVYDCDVLLAVGTSNLVEPAASLPWLAAAQGAIVGVINTSMEGQRSGAGIHHLPGPAGQVLPELVREAWPEAEH